MLTKNRILIAGMLLALLLIVGCQATVPQEEYDQLAAELATAENEIGNLEAEVSDTQDQVTEAQAQVEELQEELDTLRNQGTDAEQELRELQEKAGRAVLSAEILDAIVNAALGAEDLTEEDAISVFLELSGKVDESGDPVLQEKFQAVMLSFGGEQEAIELIQYLIQMIADLES